MKSAKSHLKRVVGSQKLTFEELSTFLSQIEFCMNSRSLTRLSGDPDDVDAITPWHLVNGFPPRSIPEPPSLEENLDRVAHWALIQAMKHHFWRRWAVEFLHMLQQRNKWLRPTRNIQSDDLVLVTDTSLIRQGSWPLGRVLQTHPGKDGLVRVATVKTATGTYVRPLSKLCLLSKP